MRPEFFFLLLGYVVIVLAVGIIFSRRMKSLTDFFLAGKDLSASLVYFSLVASWFGATSILVSTDEAYVEGVSAFWLVGMPAVATILIFSLGLVKPISRLPTISLPDLVEMRYGKATRHISAFLVIWYMVLLASSQMVALGQFLRTFLGTTYFLSLLLGVTVVLIYSLAGGLRSVVFTDSLQFFLLLGGGVSLFVFLAGKSSLQEIASAAGQLGKNGYFHFFFQIKRNFWIFVSFTLAWIISPIAWQRIQAARTAAKARQGLLASAGTLLLLYGLVVLIGIYSLPVFAGRPLRSPLVSEIIVRKSGLLLGGVLFVAVLAAVMSTMDTAINTGALSLTRDVFQQVFPSSGPGAIVLASRLSTLAVGGIAFLVATRFQSILKTIGLASEIMAEGLFIPGLAMIFLRRRLPLAGLLSLLGGGGFSAVGFLAETRLIPLGLPAWPYRVPLGVAVSLAGFASGWALEKMKKPRLEKE